MRTHSTNNKQNNKYDRNEFGFEVQDKHRVQEQMDCLDNQIQFGQETKQTLLNHQQQQELQEQQGQQSISEVMQQLQGVELLKLYADGEFLKQLITYKQEYPLQIDQIVCRITYLLGQILLLIQHILCQGSVLQSSLLLSIKQIQQAAYRLVEYQLNESKQTSLQTWQQVKYKMIKMFENAQLDKHEMIYVHSFMTVIWKSPLDFNLDTQKHNKTQQIHIQTDRTKFQQSRVQIPQIPTPHVFKPYYQTNNKELVSQVNFSELILSKHLNNQKVLASPFKNQSLFPKQMKKIMQAKATLPQINTHFKPYNQTTPQQKSNNKSTQKQTIAPRFKKSLPFINKELTINKVNNDFNQQIKIENQFQKKPFQRRLNFEACLPRKSDLSHKPPLNLTHQEKKEPTKSAPPSWSKNDKKQGQTSNADQQSRMLRQKWSVQQQSVLTSTFTLRGNLQECSKQLIQTFRSQDPKFSIAGVKNRINLIVHKVHKKLCSLNNKNNNIHKFKSNWDFIKSKSSLVERRKIYMNIVCIYTAMLNMAEGKAKTISQKLSEINNICQKGRKQVQGLQKQKKKPIHHVQFFLLKIDQS